MTNFRTVVLNGGIASAPAYEDHHRAKNWLAILSADPVRPGGLDRRFLPRGNGEFLYVVHHLSLFDPVEFGADYVTTLGRKHPKRWYGVVRELSESLIEIEHVGGAVAAILRSQQLRPPVRSAV